MNAFPLLAAVTLCVSFAVLYVSFQDLREPPLALDRSTVPMREMAARRQPSVLLRKAALPVVPGNALQAEEGLLDHDLASEDPLQSWLDRYLTPPSQPGVKP